MRQVLFEKALSDEDTFRKHVEKIIRTEKEQSRNLGKRRTGTKPNGDDLKTILQAEKILHKDGSFLQDKAEEDEVESGVVDAGQAGKVGGMIPAVSRVLEKRGISLKYQALIEQVFFWGLNLGLLLIFGLNDFSVTMIVWGGFVIAHFRTPGDMPRPPPLGGIARVAFINALSFMTIQNIYMFLPGTGLFLVAGTTFLITTLIHHKVNLEYLSSRAGPNIEAFSAGTVPSPEDLSPKDKRTSIITTGAYSREIFDDGNLRFFRKSLFENIYDREDRLDKHTLSINRRSHWAIAEFVNQLTYGGELKHRDAHKPPEEWEPVEDDTVKIIKNETEEDEFGGQTDRDEMVHSDWNYRWTPYKSYRNWGEAGLVVKEVDRILNLKKEGKYRYGPQDIFLLTPYKAQKEAIKDALTLKAVLNDLEDDMKPEGLKLDEEKRKILTVMAGQSSDRQFQRVVNNMLGKEVFFPDDIKGIRASYRLDLSNSGERRLSFGDIRRIGFEISTIDSIQGQENKVVIVSFVRCNNKSAKECVGFLGTSDGKQRINVACSRAREKLILVGDFDNTLSRKDRGWDKTGLFREMLSIHEKIYKLAKEKGLFKSAEDNQGPSGSFDGGAIIPEKSNEGKGLNRLVIMLGAGVLLAVLVFALPAGAGLMAGLAVGAKVGALTGFGALMIFGRAVKEVPESGKSVEKIEKFLWKVRPEAERLLKGKTARPKTQTRKLPDRPGEGRLSCTPEEAYAAVEELGIRKLGWIDSGRIKRRLKSISESKEELLPVLSLIKRLKFKLIDTGSCFIGAEGTLPVFGGFWRRDSRGGLTIYLTKGFYDKYVLTWFEKEKNPEDKNLQFRGTVGMQFLIDELLRASGKYEYKDAGPILTRLNGMFKVTRRSPESIPYNDLDHLPNEYVALLLEVTGLIEDGNETALDWLIRRLSFHDNDPYNHFYKAVLIALGMIRSDEAAVMSKIKQGFLDELRDLKTILKDKNHPASGDAIWALDAIGWELVKIYPELVRWEIIPALIDAMRDKTDLISRKAVESVGSIGAVLARSEEYSKFVKGRIVPALFVALKDGTTAVRGRAVSAISNISTNLVKENGEFVFKVVVPVLNDISKDRNHPASNDIPDVLMDIGMVLARKYLEFDKKEIAPVFVTFLKKGKLGVRLPSAWVLGEIGRDLVVEGDVSFVKEKIIPYLIAALKDESAGVRANAADALGEIGKALAAKEDWKFVKESVTCALMAALKDEEYPACEKGAVALGKIGRVLKSEHPEYVKEEVIPVLLNALKSKNLRVRADAAQGLLTIGDAEELKKALPAGYETILNTYVFIFKGEVTVKDGELEKCELREIIKSTEHATRVLLTILETEDPFFRDDTVQALLDEGDGEELEKVLGVNYRKILEGYKAVRRADIEDVVETGRYVIPAVINDIMKEIFWFDGSAAYSLSGRLQKGTGPDEVKSGLDRGGSLEGVLSEFLYGPASLVTLKTAGREIKLLRTDEEKIEEVMENRELDPEHGLIQRVLLASPSVKHNIAVLRNISREYPDLFDFLTEYPLYFDAVRWLTAGELERLNNENVINKAVITAVLREKIKSSTEISGLGETGVEGIDGETIWRLYMGENNPEALEERAKQEAVKGLLFSRVFSEWIKDVRLKKILVKKVLTRLDDGDLGFSGLSLAAKKKKATGIVNQFVSGHEIEDFQEVTAVYRALLFEKGIFDRKKSLLELCFAEAGDVLGEIEWEEDMMFWHVGPEGTYGDARDAIQDFINKKYGKVFELPNVWERLEYEGGVWSYRVLIDGRPRTFMFLGRGGDVNILLERLVYRSVELAVMKKCGLYRDSMETLGLPEKGGKPTTDGFIERQLRYAAEKGILGDDADISLLERGAKKSLAYLVSKGLARYLQSRVLSRLGFGFSDAQRFLRETTENRISPKLNALSSRLLGYCLVKEAAREVEKGVAEKEKDAYSIREQRDKAADLLALTGVLVLLLFLVAPREAIPISFSAVLTGLLTGFRLWQVFASYRNIKRIGAEVLPRFDEGYTEYLSDTAELLNERGYPSVVDEIGKKITLKIRGVPPITVKFPDKKETVKQMLKKRMLAVSESRMRTITLVPGISPYLFPFVPVDELNHLSLPPEYCGEIGQIPFVLGRAVRKSRIAGHIRKFIRDERGRLGKRAEGDEEPETLESPENISKRTGGSKKDAGVIASKATQSQNGEEGGRQNLNGITDNEKQGIEVFSLDSGRQVEKKGVNKVQIARSPDTLRDGGLSQCVIVLLYDSEEKTGACMHVDLSLEKFAGLGIDAIANKYLDFTLQGMVLRGATAENIRAVIVSNEDYPGNERSNQLRDFNRDAMKKELQDREIYNGEYRIESEHIGVSLDLRDGGIFTRTIKGDNVHLVSFPSSINWPETVTALREAKKWFIKYDPNPDNCDDRAMETAEILAARGFKARYTVRKEPKSSLGEDFLFYAYAVVEREGKEFIVDISADGAEFDGIREQYEDQGVVTIPVEDTKNDPEGGRFWMYTTGEIVQDKVISSPDIFGQRDELLEEIVERYEETVDTEEITAEEQTAQALGITVKEVLRMLKKLGRTSALKPYREHFKKLKASPSPIAQKETVRENGENAPSSVIVPDKIKLGRIRFSRRNSPEQGRLVTELMNEVTEGWGNGNRGKKFTDAWQEIDDAVLESGKRAIKEESERILESAKKIIPRLVNAMIGASRSGKDEKVVLALDLGLGEGEINRLIRELIDMFPALENNNGDLKRFFGNLEIIKGEGEALAGRVTNITDPKKGSVRPENLIVITKSSNVEKGYFKNVEGRAVIAGVGDAEFPETAYLPLLGIMLFAVGKHLKWDRDTLLKHYEMIPNALPVGEYTEKERGKLFVQDEKTLVIKLIPDAEELSDDLEELIENIKIVLSKA